MADFSRFGTPSKEWNDYAEKYGLPLQLARPGLNPVALQKSTNEGRETDSARRMREEGLASKVKIETFHINARDNFLIPIRVYTPKSWESSPPRADLPVYIFYHGGGFIYGTLDCEDAACSRIVAAMDIVVFHVNYRHAPQYPFPAAHNDALDAFDWLWQNAKEFGGDVDKLVVGGVSAGANLAVSVGLARNGMADKNTKMVEIRGLVLGIPWLIINKEKISYEKYDQKEKASRIQCDDAPVQSGKVLEFFVNCMGKKVKEKGEIDPDVGLVESEKLKRLPIVTFMVAGNDALRDEAFFFAQDLQAQGVPVKVHVFPGLPHGFLRFDELPSSRRWDELIVTSIDWSLSYPEKAVLESEISIQVE